MSNPAAHSPRLFCRGCAEEIIGCYSTVDGLPVCDGCSDHYEELDDY